MSLTAAAQGIEITIPTKPKYWEPRITLRTTITGCKSTIFETKIGNMIAKSIMLATR